MKIEKMPEDKNIIKWLTKINAQPSTEKNFKHAMKMYIEYTKLSPEELLDQAESELTLVPRKRQIEDHILGFFNMLKSSGVSDNTIKSRMTAVRSFYTTNQIDIPKVKFTPTRIKENDKVPTKEDLQDCITSCDALEKAVMLTGLSSGLASAELRNLKLSEFKAGYDPETGITTLTNLFRQKTKVYFNTFLSPEASKAIWEYLRLRDIPTDDKRLLRQNQREKQHTTDDSYLFIVKNVPEEYLTTRNEELRKMGATALMNLYMKISKEAGKNTKSGYNFIRSHTMRKYFNSVLLNKGCDFFTVENWMGHALNETQTAYFKYHVDDQKEIYKKYAPYLVIEKSLDVAASHEYQSLEEENEKLKAENETLHVERYEYRMLEKRIEAEKIKNNINILKLQMKIHPENAERIQKAINDLQNILEKM